MITRAFKHSKTNSYFLMGPRGTGKSTFISGFEGVLIDLLEDQTYQTLLANPSSLDTFIPSKNQKWIIIDEVQKIPALLDEVHRLIEKKRFRFILTGSSARKLKRAGANLLAGRAFMHHAYPLTAYELKGQFHLKRALERGLLPKSYLEDDFKSFLASYVSTYLKEEIQQEGLVRNLASFARFLESASFSQAQILNYSNVGADCSVDRKTVTNFFQILEDLLLAETIEVFSRRAKRELIKHRKFYFFDVGLFKQLRPKGPLDSESELTGPALETLVFQELRALNEYLNLEYKICYWHTQKHEEVDFVLYGPRGFNAIESESKCSSQRI
jgi:uncharacterized protein